MMVDDERVVQQGLGWFLRESWKRYPDETEELLLEFKDRAGRVIYQYATEKMTAAAKARFKAEKRKAGGGERPKAGSRRPR
jgi:3-methyladenine DNA glycosylase AlkD